ncbi:MAG: hypothetical protein WAM04_20880 [Candidatus Sulfotelmatobacter sp.]
MKLAEAEIALRESLALRLQLKDEPPAHFEMSLGSTYAELGDIYLQESRLDEAQSSFQSSISILREMREPEAVLAREPYAFALTKLAGLYVVSGHWPEARPLLIEADGIYGKLAGPPGGQSEYGFAITINSAQLAHADLALGRESDAREDAHKAITTARQIKTTNPGYNPDLFVTILLDQLYVLVAAHEESSKICKLANEGASRASSAYALDAAKKAASSTCR